MLKTIKKYSDQVYNSKFIQSIFKYIWVEQEKIENQTENIKIIPIKERGLNSTIEFKTTYFVQEGKYHRIFSFISFFGDELTSDFIDECLDNELNVEIRLKYNVYSKTGTRKKLQDVIKSYEKSTGGTFGNNLNSKLSSDNIERMQETISDAKSVINSHKIADFLYMVKLSADSLDSLNSQTNVVENIAENNGFSLGIINHKQKSGLEEFYNYGSVISEMTGYKNSVIDFNLPQFFPSRHDDLNTENENIWIGKTIGSNQFLSIPYSITHNENYHTAIIGKTGFAKSTLLKTIVLQAYLRGTKIVYIDPQGELKRWSEITPIDYKACNYDSGFALLNLELDDEDKEIYINQIVTYLVKITKDEELRSVYRACLYELFKSKEPSLELLKEIVKRKDSDNQLRNKLIDSMSIVFEGKLGKLLTGTQELKVDNQFTVFDFSDLQSDDHNDEFKPILMSLFTYAISKAMHNKDEKALFVIDEAYQLFNDVSSREFILKTLNKIRKMNTGVILSLQDLTPYGDFGMSLWSMCNYKFLFRHDESKYLIDILTEEERRLVRSFTTGQYMLIKNNKKILGQTINPDYMPNLKPYITYNNHD